MAIKTTALGGTDWPDGTILLAADLVATINAAASVKIDRMATDTTEYTETGIAFVTKITKTFTPSSSNNILVGVKVTCDLKSGGAGEAVARVSINNGSVTWYSTTGSGGTLGGGVAGYPLYRLSSAYGTVTGTFLIGDCFVLDTDDTMRINNQTGMSDMASYTITIDLARTGITGDTAYMDNTTVSLFYAEGGIVTTSSGKFT